MKQTSVSLPYASIIKILLFKRIKQMRLLLLGFTFLIVTQSFAQLYTESKESEINEKLAQGWNTWNTRSVLSHVLLPEGFSLNLELKNGKKYMLEESLIGRWDKKDEQIKPGPHAYDGSYTDLEIEWKKIKLRVQTASKNNELYVLVTPIEFKKKDSLLINPKMIWDSKGDVSIAKNIILVKTEKSNFKLTVLNEAYTNLGNKIALTFAQPIAITQNAEADLAQAKAVIEESAKNLEAQKKKYGTVSDLYDAMQSVMAWDIIYEPTNKRVIAPVSRIWNTLMFKGWVLFDWDTYFAAYMLALDEKELAYANAIAITNCISKYGFIPNFKAGKGVTDDRSQPPVGSFVCKAIYDKYGEKWFLEEVFDELLTWNRWWEKNRDIDGYLVWGSDPYTDPNLDPDFNTEVIGTPEAARWESGLDNSPMWDDASYDSSECRMLLGAVGLMSFYVYDCQELAKIATILGHDDIAKEVTARGEKYAAKMESMWDEEFGLYLNKDLATGKLSKRISPTMFYPLLAKIPDAKRAERMIKEHFYNPEEFWGDYMIPAISRNDPAYKDNDYWRGRIWAPMNFLVYLGIINYDMPQAKKDIVDKSSQLMLQSWLKDNYVFENFNADTGQGDDVISSDKFYHWGALLSFIKLLDEGYFDK